MPRKNKRLKERIKPLRAEDILVRRARRSDEDRLHPGRLVAVGEYLRSRRLG